MPIATHDLPFLLALGAASTFLLVRATLWAQRSRGANPRSAPSRRLWTTLIFWLLLILGSWALVEYTSRG